MYRNDASLNSPRATAVARAPRTWVTASAEKRVVLGAVFDGANMMFGRFIGDYLGELLLNVAFVLFSAVACRGG